MLTSRQTSSGGGSGVIITDGTTITGNGSLASPLAVTDEGIGTAQLADDSVTNAKLATGAVATDDTLSGDGTSGSPLSVITSSNFSVKPSARFAPTEALPAYTISGGGSTMIMNALGALPSQDGVTAVEGDIFFYDQDSQDGGIDNGLWQITTLGAADAFMEAVRIPQLAVGSHAMGALTRISEGATRQGQEPLCVSDETVDLVGTNILYWEAVGTFGNLSNATPQATGTSSAAGVATTASRSDHVHVIGDGSVGNAALASGAVATDGTTTTGDGTSGSHISVVSGGIGTTQLASGAVTNAKLASGAALANIGAGGLTSTYLAAGSALANIGLGGITSGYLASGVALANIGLGGVTSGYLASGVALANIGAGGSTSTYLASASGTNAKLASGAVNTDGTTITGDGTSASAIAVKSGGISATQLASGSVTNVKLASGAVATDGVTITGDGTSGDPIEVLGQGFGPNNPVYYVSNTGNDGISHTGGSGDPLATPQEACRRLAASGWHGTSAPIINIDNEISLGANPFLNIPSPTGGNFPIVFQTTSWTDSGLGTLTCSGGLAPVNSAPPALGTVVIGAGGLSVNAWAGWWWYWTSGVNNGLRAAIVSNTANTLTLAAGSYSLTSNLDTGVIEEPSGSLTFSGRFVIIGRMCIVNDLDFVGTGDGYSPGSFLDIQIDNFRENGIRYIPYSGGAGLGLTVAFNCRQHLIGIYYAYPTLDPFYNVPLATDLAPSQFLGTSTDRIKIYFGNAFPIGGIGSTGMYGPNCQYTDIILASGGVLTVDGPFPFVGGSMYTAGGAAIYTNYMIATAAINNPLFAEACFYADSNSYQDHFEGSVNGTSGAVNLFGSGGGGSTYLFYCTGTNTNTGVVFYGYFGGRYFPGAGFNSVTDNSGISQAQLPNGIPIINVPDASTLFYLPTFLPSNKFYFSGKNKTSGGSDTVVVVTAYLPTEDTNAKHNYYFICTFQGYRTDSGALGASFNTVLNCCYKNPAGTPTQVGSDYINTSTTFNDISEASCTFASGVSAQNVTFSVTTPVGFSAGHNLNWTATVQIIMSTGY